MFLIVGVEMEGAIQLLILVTLLLTVTTFILFVITVTMRLKQNRDEKRINQYRETFLPLIFEYMEENVKEATFEKLLGSNTLKYRVFEETIVKLLKNVEGEDADKLKRLLMIESLYKYHLKQLKAGNDVVKIEACNYFRYTNIVRADVVYILGNFVQSDNTYLAFSAASALMASDNFNDRMHAMDTFTKREGISKMALLELFYRFKHDNKSQTTEEAAFLVALIADKNLSTKKRALLIRCVSESNYYLMIKPLQSWLESKDEFWKEPEVLSALIDSQRIFLNSMAIESIKAYQNYPDRDVRKSVKEAVLVLDQEITFEKAIA
ncbi:hypothetical protein [Rhodohalobacter barkolensis]|uniref:HEAT repeat domain-containing protein n=1 Tax=Rhodohalobacter barkolensis TaxID=2053187 RepID=A0A2N0VEJ3_9BACT|nr:hypothetical protein [Rhodohalobacter barkolensis]PKD42616.1 hypothetical protein CWD77_14505 [Rhodohalobacter barkolensis]